MKITAEDRERIKIKPNELLLSGDGVFATRQGEGATAGQEAVFVRLHHCNLACGRDGGWQCDTPYTWDKRLPEFWHEPRSVGINELVAEVEIKWQDRWGVNSSAKRKVVFSGGEPLLQQKMITRTLEQLPEYSVEVETNGTITPLTELSSAQFNCSPKLENSGNSFARRRRPEVLKAIAQLPNSYFKFVVTGEPDFEEIDEIVAMAGMPSPRVLIMPEGRNAEVIKQNAELYLPMANERGYQITRRFQLEWYGDTRAT